MICNSSDLADRKNLPTASDVAILAELSHREKVRIVERLTLGEAKQKELAEDLGTKSGTLSRWLKELMQARLIGQEREGSHDPYWLVNPVRTNELLDVAARLASEVSEAHAERAVAQADVDRERLEKRESRDK
jgi:transposase-like protein